MGFFRRSIRAAAVLSDGPATLFTLTRDRTNEARTFDFAASFVDSACRLIAKRWDYGKHYFVALFRWHFLATMLEHEAASYYEWTASRCKPSSLMKLRSPSSCLTAIETFVFTSP
jgi:hypothetical protein